MKSQEKANKEKAKAREKAKISAAKLKEAIDTKKEYDHPEIHGKAGKTYDMDTSKIAFDPERFQYKLAAQGAHGVTEYILRSRMCVYSMRHWRVRSAYGKTPPTIRLT